MLDKNVRRRSGEHIAHHAAAAAGDNPDENGKERVQLARSYVRCLHANHGEYAETDGVKEKKRRVVKLLVPVQQPPHRGQENKHGNGDRRERVPRRLERRGRRDTENEIAQYTAADRCRHAEDRHAENVHLLRYGDDRAGNGKGDRAEDLKGNKKGHVLLPPNWLQNDAPPGW